jgi:hypothetical protein
MRLATASPVKVRGQKPYGFRCECGARELREGGGSPEKAGVARVSTRQTGKQCKMVGD